jgi:hypothetical protein
VLNLRTFIQRGLICREVLCRRVGHYARQYFVSLFEDERMVLAMGMSLQMEQSLRSFSWTTNCKNGCEHGTGKTIESSQMMHMEIMDLTDGSLEVYADISDDGGYDG